MNEVISSFLKNLAKNIKTILQALVFSVIIWLFISIQIFPDITMHISGILVDCEPTSLMLDESLYIESVDTSEIEIQVEGKRYSLSDLNAQSFRAFCDLSGIYESGEHTVPITVFSTKSDLDCKVISAEPSAKVVIKKQITREIPIQPNVTGIKIAEGMQIEGDVIVTPPTVTVVGEEKLINSIAYAGASAVYEDELSQSAEVSAELKFFSSSGSLITSDGINSGNESFVLSIPVYKVKTLPIRVNFTGSSSNYYSSFDASDLSYTMSIDELTIASPDSSIDNLDVIDIGELSLGQITLKDIQGGVTLPIQLPEGYKNVSGNKTVTVNFPEAEEFGQLGFTVPSDNFNIINLPSAYDVKILTNEMVVNVVGYSNYIQGLTSSNIFVTLNLFGLDLSEGVKSISPVFRLSGANVQAWVTGEDYKIDILLSEKEETADDQTS